MTADERLFRQRLREAGLPEPVAEYRFHTRRWRFDYAWIAQRVALEVEGGAWVRGRHTRAKGFLADCEKYATATALGWRVLRVPPAWLLTTRTLGWIAATLRAAA